MTSCFDSIISTLLVWMFTSYSSLYGALTVRFFFRILLGEDSQYSQPVSIDVNQLFSDLKVTSMVEMTLTGNRPRSELKRLQWKTVSLGEEEAVESLHYEPLQGTVVVLKPMEIRTFIVTLTQA